MQSKSSFSVAAFWLFNVGRSPSFACTSITKCADFVLPVFITHSLCLSCRKLTPLFEALAASLCVHCTILKATSRLTFQRKRTFMKEFLPVLHGGASPAFPTMSLLPCFLPGQDLPSKGSCLLRAGEARWKRCSLVLAGSASLCRRISGETATSSPTWAGQTFAVQLPNCFFLKRAFLNEALILETYL